jgi:hypothetical protein
VWGLVSGLLKNPERLRVGLEAMIERERAGMRGDPDREAASWLQTLSEADRERRGYLRLAAKGQMSDEELEEALAELEDTRATAERELAAVKGRKEALEALEQDRDALLDSYAEMVPEELDALTGEERRQVYGMLRLKVDVAADGSMEVRGILSENVRVLYENGRPVGEDCLCENGLASWRHVDPVRDGIGAYSYGSVVNAVNETGTLSAITQPGADKPRRAGREPAPKIRRPA